MNKRIKFILILMVSFVLSGCQNLPNEADNKENSVNDEEVNEGKDNMNDVDVYDFENIGKAPEATEGHDVKDAIKMFFSESTFDDPGKPIALNLKDSEKYVNPSLSLHGFSSYDESMELDNAEEVFDILKTYDVQSWKKDYTFEAPDTYEDGYTWRLWLQYEDGTVEKHKGKGTDRDKITPDNFDDFVKDLKNSADEHLDDDIDIYDFYYINKAPKASEKHALDDLIKIYFSAKNIAVDVEEHEIYMDALYSRNGIDTFEDTIELNDKEGLINILKKHDIQKWKDDYTTEDLDSYEDGYGWSLLLQFEDGKVEKYRGTGPLKDEVIPDNFDAFGNELEDFINEQIDENK